MPTIAVGRSAPSSSLAAASRPSTSRNPQTTGSKAGETPAEALAALGRVEEAEAQVAAVVKRVEAVGAHAHISQGELVTVIGAIGDREHVANLGLEGAPGDLLGHPRAGVRDLDPPVGGPEALFAEHPGRHQDPPAPPVEPLPPPSGSPAERFEQFCQENPGAC